MRRRQQKWRLLPETKILRAMEYTKEYLDSLVTGRIEESNQLEYKSSASLARSDGKKAEITKDISSLANAAGGILIYGIKEFDAADMRHLPEKLDPVNQSDFSREWLDQIVGLIQPRIDGLRINAVHVGPTISDYCYVVEVPQSTTAHQARDLKYYKRRNFEVTPMEDYEIRDVMNRRKHPLLTAQIRIIAHAGGHESAAHIAVRVQNTSKVLARHYKVIIQMPIRLSSGALIEPAGADLNKDSQGLSKWEFFCFNGTNGPLYPNSEFVHGVMFRYIQEIKPDPGQTIPEIRLTLFADEMEKIEMRKDASQAEQEWT